MHEVYAFGVIAPSTLVELEASFPAESGYGEIAGVHPSLGGEAAAGAYVLAHLGVATKLSGTRLSDDTESQRALRLLTEAGVDCSAVGRDAPNPVTEIVFSTGSERTVFGTYGRMLADQVWTQPSKDDIESSRIVCLDPFFADASARAGTLCRDASVPYVTIDTTPDSELARQADVLIISEEFASRAVEANDPQEILAAYARTCGGLVVLTRGSESMLVSRDGAPVSEFAPVSVEARDTTGAGDSFRAGIIYGMLNEYDDARLIETASAVSAMVCRAIPGVLHSPTAEQLEHFLDGLPKS